MKSSSILVPIVLIACLLALALLISGVFGSAQNDQSDYKDSVDGTISPKVSRVDSSDIYDTQADKPIKDSDNFSALEEVHVEKHDASSPAYTTSNPGGEYLIIAGTFRQRANATSRVNDLRAEGFLVTKVSIFDKGTFAVALVDRTNRYAQAAEIAKNVADAGYEVKVYRKR